jgi:ATP-dependent helicase/nuclease subunit A
MARDEVRVMTVHGAKGLEANTVILADTTTEPKGAHPPRLLVLANSELVWAKRKQDDTDDVAQARTLAETAARDEYRRLLYVAMTRAAERLIVCGSKGTHRIPDGCWYQLVSDALSADCASEPTGDGDSEVLCYRKQPELPAPAAKIETTLAPKVEPLPAWLARPAPAAPPGERSFTPSSAADEEAARPTASAGAGVALLRGSLTHRLLQSLPDIPAAQRRAAMLDYLTRAGGQLPSEQREQIAEQVMHVLEDPRFYELYGPGSRAEVPLVGRLTLGARPIRVSGQIDRLAITQTSVFIADFKTNLPAPRRIEQVPPAYLTQLALYRALLLRLYPGKSVRAALIWTEVPDLMELSGEALDDALAHLTCA